MSRLSRRWLSSCAVAVSALIGTNLMIPSAAGAQARRPDPVPRYVTDTRGVIAPAAQFDALRRRLGTQPTVTVIVGLQARVDDHATTPAERAANRSAIDTAVSDFVAANPWLGSRRLRTFSNVAFVAFEIGADDLGKLERSGKAASVEESVAHEPGLDESTDVVQSATAVTHGFDGSGQTVAVIDTGVDRTHPFRAGRVVEEACFSTFFGCHGRAQEIGVGAAAPCTYDPGGCAHGTHVAGIAAGRRTSTIAYDGVAPGADILAVKADTINVDGRPVFWTEDVTQSLNHIINVIDAGRPVAAVNISIWEGTYTEATCPADLYNLIMRQLIIQLTNRNTATVLISGNGGRADGIGSPGCIPEAVTVGSTEDEGPDIDTVSDFSSSSPQVDLLAPGRDITSSVPGGGTEAMFGTSMAAPHVAGAWAVYRERYGFRDDVATVLARLRASGRPVVDDRNGLTFTRLDISAAQAAWGFVLSHNPTPSAPYVPEPIYQANSTGAANTVARLTTGLYLVAMPGLGNGEQSSGDRAGGNVQVSAFGVGATHRCSAGDPHRTVDGTGSLVIGVNCKSPTGAMIDGRFTVLYQANESVRANQAGYVSALRPTTASYEPDRLQQANATGGLNTVQRSSTGTYTVTFPGFSAHTGTVQVTNVGTAAHCKVRAWTASTATVNCYNSAGALADSAFSASYVAQGAVTTVNAAYPQTVRRGAYALADNPASTSWYQPPAAFRWQSGSGTINARKTATGFYEVRIPDMPATNATNAIVTGYGTTANTCHPASWRQEAADTIVNVACLTPAGTAVDDRFTLLFTTNLSIT